MIKRDGATRIAWALPFGHRRRGMDVDPPLANEHADERLRHALRHRPGILQVEVVGPSGVALIYQFTALYDQQRIRNPLRSRQREQRIGIPRELIAITRHRFRMGP